MNKLMMMIAAAAPLAFAPLASTTSANAGAVLDKVMKAETLTVAALACLGRSRAAQHHYLSRMMEALSWR